MAGALQSSHSRPARQSGSRSPKANVDPPQGKAMSVSSSVAKTLMWIAIVIVGALLLYMVFGAVMVATGSTRSKTESSEHHVESVGHLTVTVSAGANPTWLFAATVGLVRSCRCSARETGERWCEEDNNYRPAESSCLILKPSETVSEITHPTCSGPSCQGHHGCERCRMSGLGQRRAIRIICRAAGALQSSHWHPAR
jgi:hypothetical protein